MFRPQVTIFFLSPNVTAFAPIFYSSGLFPVTIVFMYLPPHTHIQGPLSPIILRNKSLALMIWQAVAKS